MGECIYYRMTISLSACLSLLASCRPSFFRLAIGSPVSFDRVVNLPAILFLSFPLTPHTDAINKILKVDHLQVSIYRVDSAERCSERKMEMAREYVYT